VPHTLRPSSGPRAHGDSSVGVTRTVHDGLALRVRRVAPAQASALSASASALSAPRTERDVVLVHGLGLSSEYLEELAVSLSVVGPVYLLDLPGFGGVPRPARTPSVPDLARLVAAWAAEAGLDDPVLLGQSLGTQIVVEMLAADPGLSSHAVLVGPTVDPTGRSSYAQLGRFLRSAPSESSRTRRLAVRAYARSGPTWIARVLQSTLRYPTEEHLPAVEASVLVLRGSRDRIAPRAWAEHVALLVPRARSAEVEGAGHLVVHDHAAEVAALVLDHLSR